MVLLKGTRSQSKIEFKAPPKAYTTETNILELLSDKNYAHSLPYPGLSPSLDSNHHYQRMIAFERKRALNSSSSTSHFSDEKTNDSKVKALA